MLTIDIGIYHTVACVNERYCKVSKLPSKYFNIYLFMSKNSVFEQRLKEISDNLDNIKEEIT